MNYDQPARASILRLRLQMPGTNAGSDLAAGPMTGGAAFIKHQPTIKLKTDDVTAGRAERAVSDGAADADRLMADGFVGDMAFHAGFESAVELERDAQRRHVEERTIRVVGRPARKLRREADQRVFDELARLAPLRAQAALECVFTLQNDDLSGEFAFVKRNRIKVQSCYPQFNKVRERPARSGR